MIATRLPLTEHVARSTEEIYEGKYAGKGSAMWLQAFG
jgi:hypothetical protein